MNIRGFSYSLLKILSIWVLVNLFIPNLISIILLLIQSYRDSANYSSDTTIFWIIELVLYLIISVILWFGSDKFSKAIIKGYSEQDESEITKLILQQNKILEVGLILIGLYVVVTQIPYLINNIVAMIEYSSYGSNSISTRSIGGIVQALISIIIAVYFIIGREKIVTVILKIRTVGIHKTV